MIDNALIPSEHFIPGTIGYREQNPITELGFITEDEINFFFRSQGSETKYMVLSGLLNAKGREEKAAFLKGFFGTGGLTPTALGSHSSEEHSPKGIVIRRGKLSVSLTYLQAAKRIVIMAEADEYLTQAEKNGMREFELHQLGKAVSYFFSNVKCESAPEVETLNIDSNRYINSFFANTDKVQALATEMERICCATKPEDRYYPLRTSALTKVKAFLNGAYTMFPRFSPKAKPLTTSEGFYVTSPVYGTLGFEQVSFA
jgi:hypothetical protein